MKPTIFILALTLAIASTSDANAERYKLKISVDVRFARGAAPEAFAVSCFLGINDLSRVNVSKLGDRDGAMNDHYGHQIRGIARTVVLLNKNFSGGRVPVELDYDCNGTCPRRFYKCFIEGAANMALSARSRTSVSGLLGANRRRTGDIHPWVGGPRPVEGLFNHRTTVNPQGSPCKRPTECNNNVFEGLCLAKKCRAVRRTSCNSKGRLRRCVNPFTKRRGWQTCHPPHMRSNHWSDCRMP